MCARLAERRLCPAEAGELAASLNAGSVARSQRLLGTSMIVEWALVAIRQDACIEPTADGSRALVPPTATATPEPDALAAGSADDTCSTASALGSKQSAS